jgi:uncharacterized protein (TIGR03435 family)
MQRRCCLAIVLFAAAPLAEPAGPRFEVATIKPAAPNQPGYGVNWNRGWARLNNVTLKAAILYAYELRDYQLSGGPKWTDAEAFDIVGKAESPETKPDVLRVMLQGLLAERFQLTLRKETKPVAAYALVVAKGGLKLEQASQGQQSSSSGRTKLTAAATSLTGIASLIASQLGRPVADRTRAAGIYNLTLHFAPDDAPPDTTEPSFFTALEEQCGLKLEATTAPGDVYVIERAERPSEN